MTNHQESTDAGDLYQRPFLYHESFGNRDEEEISFYGNFIKQGQLIASLGCGDGVLEEALSKRYRCRFHGFDASKEMIHAAQKRGGENRYTVARFAELPEVNEPFDGVISPLLSLSYCISENEWRSVFEWLKKSLKQDAFFVFEVLLSPSPKKFQGIEEKGEHHTFRFFDIDQEHDFFSTIHTELAVEIINQNRAISQSLMAIFHPEKILEQFEKNGLIIQRFAPAYDMKESQLLPPTDVRRCMIIGILSSYSR